jgi:plastocyanin
MRTLGTLCAVLALAACGGPKATPPPATTSVDIAGYAFAPGTVTVRAGSVVTWVQRDEDIAGTGAHDVVADDGTFASPGKLAKGAAYSHRPATAGTYKYHCGVHNYMTGTLVVT